MKTAVVYWSGTGNTEAMAAAVAKAANAELFTASCFSADMADNYDAIAFGCPAMGAEALEETEFEPMFESVKGKLAGKRIALFGSYGWGDGDWMQLWEADCGASGAALACASVICQGEPDPKALADCRKLGEELAG